MIALPNIPLPLAPAAPRRAGTVVARASAPKAVAQPSCAGKPRNFQLPPERMRAIREAFTKPKPISCLARLLAETQLHLQRQTAETQLRESLTQLLTQAAHEEWSQRELARRAGIPESTLRRLRSGRVDALAWLPRIQPAAQRLSQVKPA